MSEPTVESLQAELAELRVEQEQEDVKWQRYLDRITAGRRDAVRRAEDAEGALRAAQQSAEAYRKSAIEHAEEVADRDAELAEEKARVLALVRVVEEVGRQLLAADKNEETP